MLAIVIIGYMLLTINLVLGGATNSKFYKNDVYDLNFAEVGQFPYQAGIKTKNPSETHPVCSGSIIGPRHILSEAWCVNYAGEMTVLVGCVNFESADCIAYEVERKVFHPDYDVAAELLLNNIAVVILVKEIDFNEIVGSIELSGQVIGANVPVIISGWDYLGKNLTWLEATTVPARDCNTDSTVTDAQVICTLPVSTIWSYWGGPVVGSDGKLIAFPTIYGPYYDFHVRVEPFLEFINGVLLEY